MRIASLFKLSSAAFLSSVIGAVSVLGVSSVAQAKDQFFKDGFLSEVNWQVEPYIGADAMTRVMRYKDEPTHPFQEHLDTFQPFVGVKLHKYFGVEVGYQNSEKGTKMRLFDQLQAPQFFGGGPLDLIFNDQTLGIDTTAIVKGWNLGVVGYYPICKEKTSLFLKMAYANLHVNQEIRFMVGPSRGGALGLDSGLDFVSLHDSTGMLSIVIGLKHNFAQHFGGRIFIGMDRTSRIDLDGAAVMLGAIDAVRGTRVHVEPHNSLNYGVGIYYNW